MVSRPFRAWDVVVFVLPGALPRAVSLRPFGPEDEPAAETICEASGVAVGFGEFADDGPDAGEGVATVGGEVLGDAGVAEEFGGEGEDVGGGGAAVEVAEEAGDGFDDEGVGVAREEAAAVVKVGDDPEVGHAAFDAELVGAEGVGQRLGVADAFDEVFEARVGVGEHG